MAESSSALGSESPGDAWSWSLQIPSSSNSPRVFVTLLLQCSEILTALSLPADARVRSSAFLSLRPQLTLAVLPAALFLRGQSLMASGVVFPFCFGEGVRRTPASSGNGEVTVEAQLVGVYDWHMRVCPAPFPGVPWKERQQDGETQAAASFPGCLLHQVIAKSLKGLSPPLGLLALASGWTSNDEQEPIFLMRSLGRPEACISISTSYVGELAEGSLQRLSGVENLATDCGSARRAAASRCLLSAVERRE